MDFSDNCNVTEKLMHKFGRRLDGLIIFIGIFTWLSRLSA